MSGKLKLLSGVLAAVIVLAVVFTSVAFADDPETADGNGVVYCERQGLRLQACGVCDDTISDLLGLSCEQIMEQRQEGMSLVEIAATQGIDEQTLIDAILAARVEALQQKVTEGCLTQEQADCMLERMQERLSDVLNRTAFGPPENRPGTCNGEPGFGIGHGKMRHLGQHTANGACNGEPGFGTGPGQMHHWGQGKK